MALTKVSGGILDPGINVAGVVTATGFSGPFVGGGGINAGVVTATSLDLNGNGDISGDLVIHGNLTANGDFTTLNTTLREVELLRVDANSNTVAGIITQRGSGDLLRLDDGSTRAVTVFCGIGTDSANKIDGGQVSIGSTFMWRTDTVAQVYGKSPDLNFSRFNDQFMVAGSETNGAANTGAGIQFFGHDGVQERGMAYIRGLKENGTSGNQASYLAFATRPNGGTLEERVRITSDGKFGINTASPVEKLHVTDSANCILLLEDTDSANQVGVRYKTTTGEWIAGVHGGQGNAWKLSNSSSFGTNDYLQVNTNGSVNIFANLTLTSVNPSIYLTDSGSNPDYRLYNNGGSFKLKDTTNAVDRLIVNSSGNIGVGDNNPDTRLSVTAASGTDVVGKFTSTDANAWIQFRDNSTTDTAVMVGASGDNLLLRAGSNTRVNITSAGVLQIERGSASNTALEINTTATSNACRIKFNESGSNKAQIAYSHDNDRLELVSQSGNGIAIYSGGNLVWKFDTNGHLLPNTAGAVNIGSATAEIGHVYVADSKTIYVGSDQDLRIAHDPTHTVSYIQNTGSLNIQTDDLRLYNYSTADLYLRAQTNSSVDLYYDFSTHTTPKLKTSATGIEVHGEVAASQDYPNFRPTLDLNFAAQKKLDPRITFQRTGLASFVNKFGKIVLIGANEPRFDHDPITRESKGLLIEESRTNYLKYSVDFASISGYDANYSAARSTLTSTTELAPDGTNTASKYVRTAGQGTGEVAIIIGNTLGLSNGVVYTSSVFVKNVGTNSVVEMVNTRASDVNDDSQFNLANGTIITEGSNNSLTTITPYPNDWYRISVTATHNNLSGYFWVRIYNQTEGSGFILWGGQVEAGSFPSSYIPTHENASVARGADLVEITEEEFSEFYNQTEGSFVSEIMLPSSWPMSGYGSYMMTLSDGSYNNRVTLASSTGSAQFNADINIGSNNPTRANLGSYTSGSHSIKAAMAYKISDSAGSLNGAAAVTSSPSGTLPLLTRADIGKDHANYNLLNGHMKRIMYYSKRLSNNQLRTLTS